MEMKDPLPLYNTWFSKRRLHSQSANHDVTGGSACNPGLFQLHIYSIQNSGEKHGESQMHLFRRVLRVKLVRPFSMYANWILL
jgi:hypothetical protein